jgi:uncharacterized protein YbcC (UPF0753/DUF2309 family)
VKFEEALTAMIYTQEALIDVLVEKGVINRDLVRRKIKELKEKHMVKVG